MSKLVLGAVAVVGLVAAGLGLAGVATAAPTEPSPASSAPASADAAPVPVPLVYQPVDASDGLYGARRGSVPTASTADLSPVPIANRLPVIGVTPLPARSTDDGSATDGSDGVPYSGTDESTAGPDQ
jgi:hypothetical protein